jgi:hypothetical protein
MAISLSGISPQQMVVILMYEVYFRTYDYWQQTHPEFSHETKHEQAIISVTALALGKTALFEKNGEGEIYLCLREVGEIGQNLADARAYARTAYGVNFPEWMPDLRWALQNLAAEHNLRYGNYGDLEINAGVLEAMVRHRLETTESELISAANRFFRQAGDELYTLLIDDLDERMKQVMGRDDGIISLARGDSIGALMPALKPGALREPKLAAYARLCEETRPLDTGNDPFGDTRCFDRQVYDNMLRDIREQCQAQTRAIFFGDNAPSRRGATSANEGDGSITRIYSRLEQRFIR